MEKRFWTCKSELLNKNSKNPKWWKFFCVNFPREKSEPCRKPQRPILWARKACFPAWKQGKPKRGIFDKMKKNWKKSQSWESRTLWFRQGLQTWKILIPSWTQPMLLGWEEDILTTRPSGMNKLFENMTIKCEVCALTKNLPLLSQSIIRAPAKNVKFFISKMWTPSWSPHFRYEEFYIFSGRSNNRLTQQWQVSLLFYWRI